MALTCTRKFHIDAGHRVLNHEGKCANLHGHGYNIEVTAQANELDNIGRIIDFSVIKDRFGSWLDKHWDHGFLIFHEDKVLVDLFKGPLSDQKVFVCDFNPTAENMAKYLLEEISPFLMSTTGVQITKVVVHETPNCFAEATDLTYYK